jgi:hypothetical protein
MWVLKSEYTVTVKFLGVSVVWDLRLGFVYFVCLV